MWQQVEEVLQNVKKSLMLHNGGIEIVEFDELRARLVLRFTGHCADCSMSLVTFTQGVERAFYLGVPGLKEVVLIS